MLAWRYMDFKYGVQSAMTGRFKLAKIQDLNDSYEMRGACVGSLNPIVEAELKQEIEKQYNASPNINETGVVQRDFNCVFDEIKTRHIDIMKIVLMCRKAYEELQRVLCFTDASIVDNNSDLLLWGHYADKGRGVRILVDIPDGYIVANVKYSEQRPILDLSMFNSWVDQDVFGQYIIDSVFTKGLGWAYEHEIRLITSRQASSVIRENGLEFVDFGVSSIHCIDFGPMTLGAEVNPIIEKISKTEALKHIRYRVASFDDLRYQYNYKDYSL